MKIVSVILLALLSITIINGQKKDTIQSEVVHNLPSDNAVYNKIEVSRDSLVKALQIELDRAIKLQEENQRYYEIELESDRAVIRKQKELILTLLKDR